MGRKDMHIGNNSPSFLPFSFGVKLPEKIVEIKTIIGKQIMFTGQQATKI